MTNPCSVVCMCVMNPLMQPPERTELCFSAATFSSSCWAMSASSAELMDTSLPRALLEWLTGTVAAVGVPGLLNDHAVGR